MSCNSGSNGVNAWMEHGSPPVARFEWSVRMYEARFEGLRYLPDTPGVPSNVLGNAQTFRLILGVQY